MEQKLVDVITDVRGPHYEPYGWHHWPDFPYMSYQFRRALGETQEGGGTVSECFLAASRMIPGDLESWYAEWTRVAERNHRRGDEAERKGHIQTAQNCWLRAVDYYRSAEFWLDPKDPRRLETFDKIEACSHKFLKYLTPPGEVVKIPYENGAHLDAYFIPAPFAVEKKPVLISFGGTDSYKDELWFMTGRGALQRGISVLLVDGPGQGGTLRRQGITTRYDYEVPVGRCIDYLETRSDVDTTRIAVSGSSLGGYYAARAAAFEPRLAACISHGAQWSVAFNYATMTEDHKLAGHRKWVFGCKTVEEVKEKAKAFTLEGVLEKIKCPYLIIHGGYDVLGVERVRLVSEYTKSKGMTNVTIVVLGEEDTGADHCQHDNPTLGQEYLADWLVDVFKIDERELRAKALRPLY